MFDRKCVKCSLYAPSAGTVQEGSALKLSRGDLIHSIIHTPLLCVGFILIPYLNNYHYSGLVHEARGDVGLRRRRAPKALFMWPGSGRRAWELGIKNCIV